MIKAVMFDLGGVLLENPVKVMFDYYCNQLQVDENAFKKAFFKHKDEWQKGQILENEFWQKMSKDLKAIPPIGKSLWLKGFIKAYKQKDEMFELIKLLKKNNYTIVLISNIETPIMEFIKEKGYKNLDLCIYSCEVGLAKPDLSIYNYTLDKLRIKPEEALFIDDRKENVVASQKLGIWGVVFTDLISLQKELKSLNIL